MSFGLAEAPFVAIARLPATVLTSRLAVLYTIGVLISLVGTGFLVGFGRQVKMAWDPVRRYAAAVFILCIALVFVFACKCEHLR